MAAKAPRKQLAPSRPLGPISPGGGSGRSKKGARAAGNPARVWPTPAWQKGIQTFLAGGDGGECSSSSSSSANSSFNLETEEQPTSSKEVGTELTMEDQCTSSSSGAVGVALLDDDIAQLNSDEDD